MRDVVIALISMAIGFVSGYCFAPKTCMGSGTVRIYTLTDTVRVCVPEVLVIHALGEREVDLPLASDRNDTVRVSVPHEQAVYEGEDYMAYVSGYAPRLDSIHVYHRTQVLEAVPEVPRPRRVSIGIQAGYGLTPKGFQPYIGLGVSVRIWN